MSHYQIIKIYNTDDFKKITAGIKVAQCVEIKDSETKCIVHNLKDLTVSDALSCSFCDTTFETKSQQRLHYKLDWHRYNLKQRLQGLQSVSEDNFHLLIVNSNSTDTSDHETDSASNESTTSGKSNVEIQNSKKSLKVENFMHSRNASKSAAVRHTKVFFENEEGKIFSIYRCLLHHIKEAPEVDNEIVTLALESGKKLLWTIIMIGGGHFAAAVFSGGIPVVHKTYHSYTCRSKQGSMQHSRDNNSFSSRPKSAGANLRRSNESHFIQHIQDILESWSSYIASSSVILYRAVGAYNRTALFGGKNAPLDRKDSRLRTLPFPTRKPTFKELKRVHDILSNVEIYGSVSHFVNLFQQFGCHAMQTNISPEISRKQEKLPDINYTDKCQDSLFNIMQEETVSQEKHGKNRKLINRGKERKSPVRPLPDIVMKLAQSSSESEFDNKDHTDMEMNIIEHDLEVNFNNQLQFFDNSLPKVTRKKQIFKRKIKRKCANNIIESLNRMKIKLWNACQSGDAKLFSDILKEISKKLKLNKQDMNVRDELKDKQNDTIHDVNTIVNESDRDGNTMLHLASANGYTQIARYLLHAGSNPYIMNKKSHTPYDVATNSDTKILFEKFRMK